ncbi:MAG: hypothetical protein CMM81_01150 [Rhodospirillales bacterium]|nr:hypothetical protein [Rhodospirillales bacterium]
MPTLIVSSAAWATVPTSIMPDIAAAPIKERIRFFMFSLSVYSFYSYSNNCALQQAYQFFGTFWSTTVR